MKRLFILASLFFISMAALSISDLMHDKNDDLSQVHFYTEIMTILISLTGSGFFIYKAMTLFKSNKKLIKDLEVETKKLQSFQEKVNKYSEGLSAAIDDEFEKWGLTKSEKEVGLLILKGLSTKDISELQGISDKTVRHHCTSIYKKSGMAGRTELSAHFLEDLLLPRTH